MSSGSLKSVKTRIKALFLYIDDFKCLKYCFTIMFLLIPLIYILDGYTDIDIIVILLLLISLDCFFLITCFVSHLLVLHDHKFRTCLYALVITSLVLLASVLVFESKSKRVIANSQGFTSQYVQLEGFVESTQGSGKSIFKTLEPDIGKVLVRESIVSVLQSGLRCKLEGYLVQPTSFEDFDYKGYLKHKGIYSILNLKGSNCVEQGHILKRLRYKIEDIYKNILPEPESSLLVGILLGSDQEFTEDFELAIRNSGVSHIVAASGYNISLILIASNKTFGFLSTKYRLLISLCLIWVFTFLSGFSPSLLRASVMSTIYLFSQIVGRNISGGVVLIYALTLLSLLNPNILFDIGFMLSFISTLSLIYFLPCIESITKSKFLKTYLLPTLSCTLFTIPISMYYFKSISVISVLTNLIVLPIIESTLFWGLLVLPTHSFTQFFVKGTYIQLNIFVKVVEFMSKFQMLEIEFNPVVICLAIYLVLGIYILYRYPVGNRDRNFYVKKVLQNFKK